MITLRGIAESKGDIITVSSLDGPNKLKVKFTLIDSKGRWIPCVAHDFNVEAPALKIGNEVVLWFATVLGA